MYAPAPSGRVMGLLAATLISACASVPQDRGLRDVNALLAQRNPQLSNQPITFQDDAQTIARQVDRLLAAPLTPERAIAVALLRNPQLRVGYARLGIAQADWLAASSIANPALEFSALEANAPGEMVRLGYSLVQNVTDILFLSQRRRIADSTIEQHKADIAAALQNLATDIATAYFHAVSTQQIASMRQVTAHAAHAAAELARRFKQAGNINALELARELAAAEQAELELATARAEAQAARVELNTLMGLPPFSRWELQTGLPLPVSTETPVAELVELSLKQRLDVVAKQHQINAMGEALGLAKTLRWVPFVALGVEGERESDGVNFLGPTLTLELPLSGGSRAQALRAMAAYEQARAEGDLMVGRITNQVTAAYARMHGARARAERYRNGLLPQLEAIVQRTQELQNYMIIGQFDLLAAKQEEYAGYQSYLQALRDYWLARVDLTRAVGAALPSEQHVGPYAEKPIVLPAEAPPSMHQGHGGHGNTNGTHTDTDDNPHPMNHNMPHDQHPQHDGSSQHNPNGPQARDNSPDNDYRGSHDNNAAPGHSHNHATARTHAGETP